MATVICSILCTTILEGINDAQQKLVPQVYDSGQPRTCGEYLNRGRLVITALFIPMALALSFSEQILILLGQNHQVSFYAHEYVIMTVLGIYFQAMFDLKKKFLHSLGITWLPLLAQTIATVLHTLWSYLFVVTLQMDVKGLGIAFTITQFTALMIVSVFSLGIPKLRDSLILPNSDSFRKWGDYLRIGVPPMIVVWSQDLPFYLLTIISGLISVQALAA